MCVWLATRLVARKAAFLHHFGGKQNYQALFVFRLRFVHDRIRLNLINPRVLKIERGLHVNMLDSALLRFDRERMQLVYEFNLLNKILRNNLLSENMQ